tara:strand:- start:9 stop:386 length:378 start_codon:yes stop_codon:yes gene_type:complete
MTVDRFMLGIGLLQQDGDLPEATKEVLSQEAEAFLRAGGVVTMDLWEDLSLESKAAFVIAGNRLRIENAVRVGMAAQSEEMACRVMSDADGGQMEVTRALNRTLDYGEARLKNRKEVSGERLASM